MRRILGTALLGVSCLAACADGGGDDEQSPRPDYAQLLGVWEARVEKPFEEDDPEQFVFRIQADGTALKAVVCALDRKDAVFEGPIESFECEDEATSVPVSVNEDDVAITFSTGEADPEFRLVINEWMGADVCSGDAWVEQWAEYAKTSFTAARLDLQ